MSELETIKKEIECPGCKAKIDVEMQKPKHKVTIQENENVTVKETHEHSHNDVPKEDPHEIIALNMPKGINFGKCKNGNCGTKIKNKIITTKYKTCPNCKTNTVPKSSDFCPTCGKESEEFDESDVEIETDEGD